MNTTDASVHTVTRTLFTGRRGFRESPQEPDTTRKFLKRSKLKTCGLMITAVFTNWRRLLLEDGVKKFGCARRGRRPKTASRFGLQLTMPVQTRYIRCCLESVFQDREPNNRAESSLSTIGNSDVLLTARPEDQRHEDSFIPH